ncbi:MAG TPA: YcdB/YcdC domain-containing protein [Syntrophomonadaceae bacterium]|nr:YcdB/YcdC domain-containing protein [Syntrophomonadaceae bacterium]
MKPKSWLAGTLFLLGILLMAGFSSPVLADDNPSVSLEQAIRSVKDAFVIPAEFSEFRSGYTSNNGQPTWNLDWNSSKEPVGNFSAQVNAQTGEIQSMSIWKNEPMTGSTMQIPRISQAEAQQKASELLQRLASRHLSELQLVQDADPLLPLSSYGPASYNFHWQRVYQGVPFPSNGAYITIRGDNGSVSNYSLQFTASVLPSTAGAISMEQARQAFNDAGMLELMYFQPSRIRPLSSGQKPEVILVYQLNHSSGGIIDALTGKPLPVNDNYGRYDGLGGGGGEMSLTTNQGQKAASNSSTPLSPEEVSEIEKSTKLISQEEAIQAVKKVVEIPTGLSLQQASLMSRSDFIATHIWDLGWSAQDSKNIGKSMNAQVNADNGELLSYGYYDGSDQTASGTGAIDRQAAQALADAFIKKVQPQRFEQVQLNDNQQAPWIRKMADQQSTQFFSYRRMVQGIPFPSNNISITVDTVNKRISNFNLYWGNYDFPSPGNSLNKQQAVDAFLQAQPLTMALYQEYGPNGPGAVKLVYQPIYDQKNVSYYNMIDAKNGQLLDGTGKPASLQHALRFNDIQDSFASNEITILGQAGLFGEYGQSFHPDEKITTGALLRAMLQVQDNNSEIAKMPADEILNQARSRGWIKEDVEADAQVSRVALAKLMIRYLNLERAAYAVGIFQVPYADADALPEGSLAYVALTNGLGILRGDGTNFNPQDMVTRAEAAAALVQTLKVAP